MAAADATAPDTTAPDCSTVTYSGNGTSSDPYEVSTVDQLQCMGNASTATSLSDYFTLVDDVDASGTDQWNGGSGFEPVGGTFNGTFDGAGYDISGLYIDFDRKFTGLFNTTGPTATVRNVSIVNGTVLDGNNRAGLVAGWHKGTATEVSATGTVSAGSGSNYAGGLVGFNDGGTVSLSYASVSVEADSTAGGLVGGIDGGSQAIVDTYATGDVTGSKIGGLVGQIQAGTVKRSYSTGTVTLQEDSFNEKKGGLVGANFGTVTDSYWDVDTSGQSSSAGGTGLTTAEMTGDEAPSNMGGFDFTNTWDVLTVSADGASSYPFLRSNTQSPAPGKQLYAGGDGTASNPYEIANWYHLNNTRQNLGANFTLVAQLDDSTTGYGDVAAPTANGGTGFAPLGNSSTPFTGTFDGNGYAIANLTIDRVDSPRDVGLFGYAGSGASIRNVTPASADVEATGGSTTPDVGTLAGTNDGTIVDASVIGSVTHDGSYVGGLVGFNGGTVANASTAVNVTGGARAGGVVGINGNPGVVRRSTASGNVSGSSLIGGLVGANSGDVGESYATGNVSGTSFEVGGLAGGSSGSITDSYATGAVSGDDSVGGLVGDNSGGTVEDAYAVGTVTGNSAVGGLVGTDVGGSVTDGYWNVETTGQSSSDGGTGLTTLGMVGGGAERRLAFDFGNTWTVVDRVGGGNEVSYPILRNATQTPGPGLRTLYAGGAGSDADPFQIANWTHLDQVRVNLDANFTLVADLDDASSGYADVAAPGADGGAGFDPLGDPSATFVGHFDGADHAVADLTINRTSDYVGLFGYVGSAGRVGNVTLSNATVDGNGNDWVAMLAGRSDGLVENVAVDGRVDGGLDVAGVVGWNDGGTVENANAAGAIRGTGAVAGIVGDNRGPVLDVSASVTVTASGTDAGGLVGFTSGPVRNGSSTGPIEGSSYVGGAVGEMNASGTVANVSASGNVTATNTGYDGAGGLVGYSAGTVRDSNASGDVDGAGYTVGGLVGQNDGTVRNGTATGDVFAECCSVGGLVGYGIGTVEDSKATGNVTTNATGFNAAGGLVGYNDGGEVRNSSAAGRVDADGRSVGGLVGLNDADTNPALVANSTAAGSVTSTSGGRAE